MPIFNCFFPGGRKSTEVKDNQLVPVDSGELRVLPLDYSKVPSSLDEQPVPVISELPRASGCDESPLVESESESEELKRQNSQCHISEVFKFSELEEATGNFDPSRVLGIGGYGTVYSGILKDGRRVSITRLREDRFKSLRLHDEKPESNKLQKFMKEVAVLTSLRHENLVQLYGCTSPQANEMLLVQEYVPNRSVAHHFHGAGTPLPWSTRLNIAIQTASALAYLHASNMIHRDVKTSNILLDRSFHAKVADFGLSRLFPHGVTHVTTDPNGTPGYIDPEYYEHCHLSDKSDVYSFGVTLIELISSLPAFNEDEKQPYLSNFAVEKISSGRLQSLVDRDLRFESDDWITETVNAVAELALRCLQSEGKLRPSMAEVLNVLEGIRSGCSQSALASSHSVPFA